MGCPPTSKSSIWSVFVWAQSQKLLRLHQVFTYHVYTLHVYHMLKKYLLNSLLNMMVSHFGLRTNETMQFVLDSFYSLITETELIQM